MAFGIDGAWDKDDSGVDEFASQQTAPRGKQSSGLKTARGKRDWSAVPVELLEAIVDVFMHGNAKYERDNWQQNVKENPSMFHSALYRHIAEHRKGVRVDKDSGLNPMAHVAAGALILLWLDQQQDAEAPEDEPFRRTECATCRYTDQGEREEYYANNREDVCDVCDAREREVATKEFEERHHGEAEKTDWADVRAQEAAGKTQQNATRCSDCKSFQSYDCQNQDLLQMRIDGQGRDVLCPQFWRIDLGAEKLGVAK